MSEIPGKATREGFVCTLGAGDWLVIRAGGAGRTEEVIARCVSQDEAFGLVAARGIRPAYIVCVASARSIP